MRARAGRRNIRLTIEFDGTGYAGWQVQPDQPTVQGVLARALQQVLGEAVDVYGCSRTDAGVSARAYVANFWTESRLTPERLRAAINFYLPDDIFVKSADEVAPEFHARYSARGKRYSYYIVRNRSPLRARHAWEFIYPLNVERLRVAGGFFVGERDFNPFCYTTEPDGVCKIFAVGVRARADELIITVRGDRFLYKMVRRIVGAMVAYASYRLTRDDIKNALAGKKAKPFAVAPAKGLILEKVYY